MIRKHILQTTLLCVLLPAFLSAGSIVSEDQDMEIKRVPDKGYGREIESKRTPNSKTFLNEQTGELTAIIESQPLHFKDKAGRFHEIDNTIRLSPDGSRYYVSKGIYQARFPICHDGLATITSEDGSPVQFQLCQLAYVNTKNGQIIPLQDAKPVQGVTRGNTITYYELFDGIDVEYQYLNAELKQNIYISQAARDKLRSPQDYNLKDNQTNLVVISKLEITDTLDAYAGDRRISSKNNNKLILDYDGDEAIKICGNNGIAKMLIKEDFAFFDENDKKAEKEYKKMARRFYNKNGDTYLYTGVPYSWLESRPRGVVVLDPSFAITGSSITTTYIASNGFGPNNNNIYMYAGRENGESRRSLIRMPVDWLVNYEGEILSAELQVYYYSEAGDYSQYINCHRITSPWDANITNWALTYDSEPVSAIGINKLEGYYGFPVTQLVKDWKNGTTNNYGVLLKVRDESYGNDYLKFKSNCSNSSGQMPRLVVTYSAKPIAEYTYDAYGRPVEVSYGEDAIIESNTYNTARGWLTKRIYTQKLDNNDQHLFTVENQAYDAAGNLKQQTYRHSAGPPATVQYGYDGFHRLTSYTNPSGTTYTYSYDANGNMLTKRGVSLGNYDKDKLLNNGQFAYDAAGRATTIHGSNYAEYNCFNNMVVYREGSAGSPPVEEYAYDDANLRVHKHNTTGEQIYYLRSGLDEIMEFDANGNILAEYVYGVGGKIAKIDPKEGYLWFFKDLLGSTRQLSTSALRRDYYPYGEAETVAGIGMNYQFTGKELDNASGLYYFGSRYYDQTIGRWITCDPSNQYFSPYVYCGNNPLKLVDKDGGFAFLVPLIAYITAVTTSPDLNFDMMQLANDWSSGNKLDVAIDIAGIAIPGIMATQLKGSKSIIEEAGEKLIKSNEIVEKTAEKVDDVIKDGTEIVERAMSKEELKATKETGLLRGGREGVHNVAPVVNRDALRARQRLALPQTPEARVKMKVPAGKFSKPTKVKPDYNMPGGGFERKATGEIPVEILEEQIY